MTIENSNMYKFLTEDERKLYTSLKRKLFWKNFLTWGTFAVFLVGGMWFGLALESAISPAGVWAIGLVLILFWWFLARDMKKLARFCAQMEGKAEAREARKLGVS